MGTPIVTTPAVTGENGPIPAASTPPAAPFDALMALLTSAAPDAAGVGADPALTVADPTSTPAVAATTPTSAVVSSLEGALGAPKVPVSPAMVNAAAASPDADLVDMLAMSALASRRVVARVPTPVTTAALAVQPEDFIGPVRPNELTAEPAALMTQVTALPEAAIIPEDFIGPVLPPERRPATMTETLPQAEGDLLLVSEPALPEVADNQAALADRDAADQLPDAEGLLQPIGENKALIQPVAEDMLAQPKAALAPQDEALLAPIHEGAISALVIAPGVEGITHDEAQVSVDDGIDRDTAQSISATINQNANGVMSAAKGGVPLATQAGSDARLTAATKQNQAADLASAEMHATASMVSTSKVSDTDEDADTGALPSEQDTSSAQRVVSAMTPAEAAMLVAMAAPKAQHQATIEDPSRSGEASDQGRKAQILAQQSEAQRSVQTERAVSRAMALEMTAAQITIGAVRGKPVDMRGNERRVTNDAFAINAANETEEAPGMDVHVATTRVVSRQGASQTLNTPRDQIADALSDRSVTTQSASTGHAFEIDAKVAAMVQSITVTGDTPQTPIVGGAPTFDPSPIAKAETVSRDTSVVSAVAADGRRDTQRDAEIRERQIKQQVTMALRAGGQEVRMQLYPPGLGQVMIRLALDGQKLRLSMKADNAEASDALIQAEGGLRDALSRDGFNLAGFDVHDDEHKQKREQAQPQPNPTTNTGTGDAFSVDMTA